MFGHYEGLHDPINDDMKRLTKVLSKVETGKILALLKEVPYRTASELSEELDIHIATAQKYLKELKECGIIDSRMRTTSPRPAEEFRVITENITINLDLSKLTDSEIERAAATTFVRGRGDLPVALELDPSSKRVTEIIMLDPIASNDDSEERDYCGAIEKDATNECNASPSVEGASSAKLEVDNDGCGIRGKGGGCGSGGLGDRRRGDGGREEGSARRRGQASQDAKAAHGWLGIGERIKLNDIEGRFAWYLPSSTDEPRSVLALAEQARIGRGELKVVLDFVDRLSRISVAGGNAIFDDKEDGKEEISKARSKGYVEKHRQISGIIERMGDWK